MMSVIEASTAYDSPIRDPFLYEFIINLALDMNSGDQ